MKAIWNGQIIAESAYTIVMEGYYYFPHESVKKEYLVESDTETSSPWKGIATFFNLLVDGLENPDSAWHYAEPTSLIMDIKNHIAFWRGVEIMK